MIQFKAKTANGEIINSALSPFSFPAGEAHTKREERRDLEATEIAVIYGSKDIHEDLFQLAMWDDTVFRDNPDTSRVLVMPYFPGARADRGAPFGADIYAKFLNEMCLNQIISFDPHSNVVRGLLDSAEWYSAADLFSRTNTKLQVKNDYLGIIIPDKGAKGRAEEVAKVFGVPTFQAEKTRDFETGKLTGFAIETLPNYGRYLVVDDICDGGGTFLGLAEASGLSRNRLDLYVSHGVFSNNAVKALPEKFSRILTTNSYDPNRALDSMGAPDAFQRLDIINVLLEKVK